MAQRTHRGLVGALAVAAGIALAAGCGSVDTAATSDAGAADAALVPDATPAPDAPDNPSCTQACLSETSLRECAGGESTVECPLGCVTGEARCRTIAPSNGASTDHLMGVTGAFTIAEDAQVIVDTDVGTITVGGEELRGPGVGVNNGIGFQYTTEDLSVLAVQGMTMGAGSNLRARGGRPLLILSAGDVEIAGTIDVSGGCDSVYGPNTCGGPGGGQGANSVAVATGCGPGENGTRNGTTSDYGGGGGGGSGQAGAAGAAVQDGAGGSGGQACEASLVPLRGGSGGGQGYSTTEGGGGGGAVQITSFTAIRLVSPAVIDAGGSGGEGSYFGGGGGGGAAGLIHLHAPVAGYSLTNSTVSPAPTRIDPQPE